jgi:hypothetical protein
LPLVEQESYYVFSMMPKFYWEIFWKSGAGFFLAQVVLDLED